jgi:hypothetical protein
MSGVEATIESASFETYAKATKDANKTASIGPDPQTSDETHVGAFDETVGTRKQSPHQESRTVDYYLQRSLWQQQWAW